MISWIKNGVQVSSGTRFLVNSSTGVLEIRDIGKEDEGRWECAARNSIGFASEVFELRVIGKLLPCLISFVICHPYAFKLLPASSLSRYPFKGPWAMLVLCGRAVHSECANKPYMSCK